MVRLTYFSRQNIDPAAGSMIQQLNAILASANRHNRPHKITGGLIFDEEWFVQVLEGERDAVWSTFKTVERDERHTCVTPVELRAAPGRYFRNWWMGCIERSGETASIFAPYLRDGRFQPPAMLGTEILMLLIDLTKVGYKRELTS